MYGENWGGSEQLWGAAAHVLLKTGHRVAAGLNSWPGSSPERTALSKAGCELHIREYIPRLPGRILNRLLSANLKILPRNAKHEWLPRFRPDLVIVCQAWTDDGLEIMEMCRRNGWKYATIVQAASEYHWPDDERALRLHDAYQGAARAFFVSQHNWRLTEQQIAAPLTQGEIVWNPVSVDHNGSLPWPNESNGLKLACVGRLQPDAKGQDILLKVLAAEKWRQRGLSVTFFGKGTNRNHLEKLAKMLGVTNISFGGFVGSISGIWREHHALVLPTRKEGLPIVLLEASLCGRPAICNRVAGIPEVIEDGETGFMSPAPEVDLFGNALERAWEQRGQWCEMGRKAAARVRSLLPEKPAEAFANRVAQLALS